MSNNIFSTLQGLLKSDTGQKVLQLAKQQFPGPIQDVLNDYLNGISLQLGSVATLTVDPSSQQLSVQAQAGQADLALQATADGATLTLRSTQYPDAQVVLTFSPVDGGVKLELAADMGASLQWPLQALWPQMLAWSPANQVVFANGKLDLVLAPDLAVTFKGLGSMLYDHQDFLNAAMSVQHTAGATGVMFAVVAPQWSPGSLWAPLSALTFSHSGLVVSTVPGKSGSLVTLGLLSAQDVPATQADFDIQAGLLFFTSLQLTDSLAAIAQFMGDVSQLDLFASYARSNGAIAVQAVLKDSFSAKNNGVFTFDGLTLEWDLAGSGNHGNCSITATAAGQFHPDAQTAIDLSLQGQLLPSEGDLNLTLKLQNWNQPFGWSTVQIEDLQGGVSMGAEAAGVTLNFGGDIKLSNPTSPQYEFEVGFEVEVVDFEVPNGIALWTKADQQPMTLSNVLDAAFALDFSPQALTRAGEPEVADVVAFLDDLVSIEQFTAWFVEGASLQKIGALGPFAPGFGLQAQLTLLQQADVQVSLTLAEKANADAGFSGFIEVSQPVVWGSVFRLSGWDTQSGQPAQQGPVLAIAATPDGIVVPGVNQGQPVRFYSSLYLSFLDVVSEHLYALATADQKFEIDYAVQDGSQAGGCGAWSGDSIQFKLDPAAYQLSAAFSFNFGWQNIQFGAIALWGVTVVPAFSLPDFSVAAGLSLSASSKQLVVTGFFDFDLLGLHLALGSSASPCSLLNVNISGVISKLEDIASALLALVKQQAAALLQEALQDLDAFLAWAKQQWRNFVNGLQAIGQVLKNQFKQVEAALVNLLKGLGAPAAEVQQVMVALGYDLQQAEDWVGNAFGCAVEHASNLLP
ncbi:hypothetical protein [Pseudoduganella sp. HUAS MS19]